MDLLTWALVTWDNYNQHFRDFFTFRPGSQTAPKLYQGHFCETWSGRLPSAWLSFNLTPSGPDGQILSMVNRNYQVSQWCLSAYHCQTSLNQILWSSETDSLQISFTLSTPPTWCWPRCTSGTQESPSQASTTATGLTRAASRRWMSFVEISLLRCTRSRSSRICQNCLFESLFIMSMKQTSFCPKAKNLWAEQI